MAFEGTMEMLRRGVAVGNAAEWRRMSARVAWIKQTIAALREAQRHMDERCFESREELSEEEFERIVAEEQAKVCAILDQLHAVRDHDRWPEHLYFGRI